MLIKLPPRLAACAGLVSRGGVLLDIGTDHALLPCFLAEANRVRLAYACDVAPGPLSAAKADIARFGLSGRVIPLLSDGFKDIPADILPAVTDVVIAGMGGELIAEILSPAPRSEAVNFILQPNSRASHLRRFLHDRGFQVASERAVIDGRFAYTIINAKFSGEPVPRALSDLEAEIGHLDPADPPSREYLLREASRLKAAADGMSRSQKPSPEAEKILNLSNQIAAFADKKS